MLLAIDIGNSNIVFGVFEKDICLDYWRIKTDKEKTSDEYFIILGSLLQTKKIPISHITGIIISCVVPSLTEAYEELGKKYFHIQPIVVNSKTNTGIIIKYHKPEEVGADRIVNAVAVFEKYETPAIIIDFGTATTFDYVNELGEYLGGVILPGIGISYKALFENTAKLPKVEIKKPECVIGKTTVNNIQSGVFYGVIGQIKEIVERMKNEIKQENVTVIATGGFIDLLKEEKTPINYFVPDLTLVGLRLIYEKNSIT